MLQELLQLLEPLDWNEAPAEMGFESPYGVLLDDVATLNYELVQQASPRSDARLATNGQIDADKDTTGPKNGPHKRSSRKQDPYRKTTACVLALI